jgi:hypothetical protein
MKESEFNWKEEWKDMPEFIQEKQEPYAKIIVRFANEEDLNEFSNLIGQKLNKKSKSIWHPKLIRGVNSNKRYVILTSNKLKLKDGLVLPNKINNYNMKLISI